jgi:hypothetical protein
VTIQVDAPELDDEPAIEIPRDITPPVVDGLGSLPGLATPNGPSPNSTPGFVSAMKSLPAKRLASATFGTDEYASPAFIKRARVSYGSLFEGGMDMLDEERVESSRRKRPRFSMNSNWRYASRTPSPNPSPSLSDELPEGEDVEPKQAQRLDHMITATTAPQLQPITDQGPQTQTETETVVSTSTKSPPTLPTQAPPTIHDGHGYTSPLPHVPVAEDAPTQLDDSFLVNQEASVEDISSRTLPEFYPPALITEPAQDFIGELSHSHDLSTHNDSHPVAAPDLPATTSTTLALDTREEFTFADNGPHVLTTNEGQDGEFATLHEGNPSLFPHVSGPNIPDAHLPAPFVSHELHQTSWTTASQVSMYPPPPSYNNIHHPVEIIDSSSPQRQPSSDVEEDFDTQQHSDASDASGEQDLQEGHVHEDKEDRALDADRADYGVDDDESQEGSDVSGEDYDLRNYDAAKADDVVEPEETPSPSPLDPDEQIANLDPGSENDEEGISGSEPGDHLAEEAEEEEQEQEQEHEEEHEEEVYSSDGERQTFEEDIGEFEEDQEGNYDEEDYEEEYEEEEDEWEEEEEHASRPAASQDPVFISLLSDSEDEAEPSAASQPPQGKLNEECQSTSDNEAEDGVGMARQRSFDEHEDEDENEDADEDEDGLELEAEAEDGEGEEVEVHQDDAYDDEVEEVDGDEEMQDADALEPSLADHLDDATDKVSTSEKQMARGDVKQGSASQYDARLPKDKKSSPATVAEVRDSTEMNQTGSVKTTGEKDPDVATQHLLLVPMQPELDNEPQQDDKHATAPYKVDLRHNIADLPGDTHEGAAKEATEVASPSASTNEQEKSAHTKTSDAQDVDVTVDRNEVSAISTNASDGSLQPAAAGIGENQLPAKAVTQEYQTEQESEEIPSPTLLRNKPEVTAEESLLQATEVTADSDGISIRDFSDETSQQISTTTRPEHPVSAKPNTEPSGLKTDKANTTAADEPAVHHLPRGCSPPLFENLPSSPPLDRDMDVPLVRPVPDAKRRKTEKTGYGATNSPPQTQPSLVVNVPGHDEVSRPKAEKPPTPNEIVQEVEAEAPVPARDSLSEEDDYTFAAEQQIMTESQEYESTQSRNDALVSDYGNKNNKNNKDGTSLVPSTQASPPMDKKTKGKPERDILITVQSLRSWDRRKSTSAEAPSDQPEDPSVSLARAPGSSAASVSHEDSKPQTTLHVTRSMVNRSDDPSLDLARAPEAPTKTKSTQRYTTPDRSLETPALSQSVRSKTPDSPADVMNTPSVIGSSAGNEHASTLKRKLAQELRDHLPDYLPLKSVRSYLSRTTDVMAVVTTTPPQATRPKNGPRDYMLEVMLTDPSAAPSSVVVAQFFRPHQTSLPVVQPGDVVILRRFQIISLRKRGVGIRTGDDSSWAVIEKGDEEMLPQIKGPPVELAGVELTHAEGLRRWWGLLDAKARDKMNKAIDKMAQAGKPDGK